RQVVGTIIGSLLIIGNSEHSVQNCVAVTLGRQKSLKDDPQLSLVRRQLGGEHALTFGYVPPGNSARLLAISLPLLMGRAPADSEFQRVVTASAANIFGNLGWTSRGYLTGVEDRYQITLQPQIVARLKPSFRPPNRPSQMQRLLPDDVFSATSYKFENPAATWQSLKTSVSSQVDALSTILFSTLLKSSLLSYGINDPESFLAAVDGELLTMRLDENAERSIIIGGVQDRIRMRDVITKGMGLTSRDSPTAHAEIFGDSQDEFAATFIRDLIVVGSAAEVRRFVGSVQRNAELDPAKVKRMTFFGASTTSANIVTFTNDSDRIRTFISAIIATTGKPTLTSGRLEEIVDGLPYAVTETSLRDNGLERITRSPLGQFSTLLPLVVPQQLNPTKTGSESK
ncbi:MAG: hypothetical protein LC775_06670, partial [Acidobacteria bacterium]|nr:hypothetical protein [Acidobacteriota bacterium]